MLESEIVEESSRAEPRCGIWECLEDGRWGMLKIAYNNVIQTQKGWDHHVCTGE